ncbi:MAG: DNA repair protein RecO [Candidatus Acidulodesulfobacterium ferriphilum]|uniref:DNA repair protein RecO n=1 Tax=Candidatus Acidulodesulfobacterium ferriphilum TaxID=2597223 RepID=A0A519B9E1_9DELT|nr:MAG: DNA repair protein RecO [Candidatus Acidulodesulfobacterium ferriphilum]
MKLFSTNAFVIYIKKLNEADLLLSYITEDYGKITCFANNARKSRKRFLGKLEPAMLTNIKFYEKAGMTLDILYEADIVEDYKNVRKDIDIYLFLTKIAEVSRVLCQERDNNKNIFYLTRAIYKGLNHVGAKASSPDFSMTAILLKYEIYFISNLLKYTGIFPNFSTCTVCSEKNADNKFYFSLKKGGVVCGSCANSGNNAGIRNLPVNFINLSNLMMESDLSIINKLVVKEELLRECSTFLEDFLSFHIGKRLKSFESL